MQAAASAVIPLLVACVNNPETQLLRERIVTALRRPDTTLLAVDDLLSQAIRASLTRTEISHVFEMA